VRRHLGIPRKRRRASLHVVWRRSCRIAIALSLAVWNEEIVLFCISFARFVFGARIMTSLSTQFRLIKSHHVKLNPNDVVLPSPINGGHPDRSLVRGFGGRRCSTSTNLLACACAAAPAKP
jgi:hypothetical protein